GYKFLKKVFEIRFNQWLFRWLHPDLGTRMGLYFSHKSRIANVAREEKSNFKIVPEEEMLYHYCQSILQSGEQHDFFIFGHRHVPLDYSLNEKARMIILGDWVTNYTYAVFDGEKLELKRFES
ncbi:MAG TPA: UDP-2,3-diacylglucosamine diphosphatase, partial [Bacteroidales bacterium]|nr:UDP-2,3-diacylglucosamine diphosphatase [Bacteroidales bacterium]